MRLAYIMLMLLILACTNMQDDMTPVKVRLKWFDQAQFAGMYVAQDKGLYEEQKLEVELLPYNYSDPIEELVQGRVDFIVLSSDKLLLARQEGYPVKAVAVIYKVNPSVIYVLENSTITKPEHLDGKRLGVQPVGDTLISYTLMKEQVDVGNVTEVPVLYNTTELIQGDIDASMGYMFNEPYFVIEQGHAVRSILMADYGVAMYADLIVTTEDIIINDPGMISAFVQETIRGWKHALEYPDEAIGSVMERSVGSREHQEYMLQNSLPLILAGPESMGVMNAETWRATSLKLEDIGLLSAPAVYAHAYTNEFVE